MFPQSNQMKKDFNIIVSKYQIGVNLFSNHYSLVKNGQYVCSIKRPFLPDEEEKNNLIFDVLGECEERAFCIPNDIIKPENKWAVNTLNEYLEGRNILKNKSGWVTKTQFWVEKTLLGNEFELNIIKD